MVETISEGLHPSSSTKLVLCFVPGTLENSVLVVSVRFQSGVDYKLRSHQHDTEIWKDGGVGGIRTLEGVATQHAFQACALNRSATTPEMTWIGLCQAMVCAAHYSHPARLGKL